MMTKPMSQMGKWLAAGLLLTALTGCSSSETELLPLEDDADQASVEEIMGGAHAAAEKRPTK
jgi:uncharacterized lipoprotein